MLPTCAIYTASLTDWKTWASLWTCLLPPKVAYAFIYECIQAPRLCFPMHSALRVFLWCTGLCTDYCNSFMHHFKSKTRGQSLSPLKQGEMRECLQAKQTVLGNEEHLLCGDIQFFTGICGQDWTCAGAFQIWQRFEIKCLKNLALQQPCFTWRRVVVLQSPLC